MTSETEAKITQLEAENHTLKDRVASFENEMLRLKAEVASFEQRLSLNNMDYPSSKRFVPKPSQIRALPLDVAIIFRPIEQNSVVTVLMQPLLRTWNYGYMLAYQYMIVRQI